MRFARTILRAPREREAKRLVEDAIGSGLGRLTEDDGLARFQADQLSGAAAPITGTDVAFLTLS